MNGFDDLACDHSLDLSGLSRSAARRLLTWHPLASLFLATIIPGVCVTLAHAEVGTLRQMSGNGRNTNTLSFTKNIGQWPDSICFRASSGSTTIWIDAIGVYYQFHRFEARDSAGSDSLDRHTFESGSQSPLIDRRLVKTALLRAVLEGSNPRPEIVEEGIQEHRCNYFLGSNPARWRTNVPNYSLVAIRNIYPGIDLKYYSNAGKVEYDFVVAPRADVSRIRVRFFGATSMRTNDVGDLVIESALGSVVEKIPIVYQVEAGIRRNVACTYDLAASNTFGFEVGPEYDPSLPLVIDPVLLFSTFLGGSDYDYSYGIAVDTVGATYIAGRTISHDFPVLLPLDSVVNGFSDAFVAKLEPDSGRLVFGTYFGGSGDYDQCSAISLDTHSAIYVVGGTWSADFPVVHPAQQRLGGLADAFVAKLSGTGDSLVYSTYLGGALDEGASSIAVAKDGSAFVVGTTNSPDFPTRSPVDGTLSGIKDGFVGKLSADGSTLLSSTFLGGGGWDDLRDAAVDQDDKVLVVGYTTSSDLVCIGALDSSLGGTGDAFIAEFDSSGKTILFSTYLGGSDDVDAGYGVAVDGLGSAYVVGGTSSADFPTLHPVDNRNQDSQDAFITKLDLREHAFVYSTFLGGADRDWATGVAIDNAGFAYVVGRTSSGDLPIVRPFSNTPGSYFEAVLVAKLSKNGSSLEYCGTLGGFDVTQGEAIAVDPAGCAYVTGATFSPDFPLVNPIYSILSGPSDVFVTKISPQCCTGMAGNVDGDVGDVTDISDLSSMVAYLFFGGAVSACVDENDVDGSGTIAITDLSLLVDFLFFGGTLPSCP
jgi:hypothetical protein